MREFLRCVMILLLCLSSASEGWGRESMRKYKEGERPLLDSVFAVAREVAERQWHFSGQYYYRGMSQLKKKTPGVLTLSNRRYYRKGGRNLLTEYVGDVEYTQPDDFVRKPRYTYGVERRYELDNETLMEFCNLTIYNDNLFGDHILSPLSRRNARHYRYSQDSVCGDNVYFSYRRKSKNMQLVDGSFVFDTARRCVTRMTIRGTYNFVAFDETVVMGTGDGDERLWLKRADLVFKAYCYGSKFEGEILYTQHDLEFMRGDELRLWYDNDDCNLTERYALALDTSRTVFDSVSMARLRTDLLPDSLAAMYVKRPAPKQKSDTLHRKSNRLLKGIGEVGEVFFHDHELISTPQHSLKIKSPVLGYSNSRGVTIREDLVYVNRMTNGQRFTLRPSVSYFNKNNEVTGRMRSEYLLSQRHNEKITAELGVRNVTTNYESLQGRHPDPEEEVTTLRFRDLYVRADASRELFNGFDITIGAHLHHRTSRDNAAELGLDNYYRDFAPLLTLTYTPKMKYYLVGNRKERLGSKWPTFLANYSRGIKGVLGSTHNYERWETLARQDCRLSAIHRIIWQLGYGMFTAKEAGAFVQYDHFNEGISAYDWEDDCSGVFQLLDSRYYNNSYHYFRAHAVYESPMLLLGNFNTHFLRAERLYGNLLMTEGLVPYFELGYGVSTAILDISFFSSYLKSEKFTYGFKFNLYL